MFASVVSKLIAPFAVAAVYRFAQKNEVAHAESPLPKKSEAQNYLNGIWVNETGSVMTIKAKQGVITGAYQSAVGNAKGRYFVLGTYNNNSPRTTVGWSVAWNNTENGDSESNSSWSGQLVNDQIHATWLLTKKSDISESWAATRVGYSIFHKVEDLPDSCTDQLD